MRTLEVPENLTVRMPFVDENKVVFEKDVEKTFVGFLRTAFNANPEMWRGFDGAEKRERISAVLEKMVPGQKIDLDDEDLETIYQAVDKTAYNAVLQAQVFPFFKAIKAAKGSNGAAS